jgi:hypothetical protein
MFFFCFPQGAQFAVPFRFKFIGHQAVGGVHLHVAALG